MNESNEITVGDIMSIVYVKNKDLAKRSDFSRKLEHHELIFRISGSCEVEFDDQKFIEKENYIRFLPRGAGEKYRAVRLDDGDCVDIFFDSDKPLSDKAFCRLSSHADKVRTLFLRAENAWRKKRSGYRYVALACVYEILSLIGESEYHGDKNDWITAGVEYIENNFLTEIDFDKCGEKCGISYTYFKRLFSARFGMSPKAYAISLRIKHAADLLGTGIYSVGETARLCGYENEYYFCRDFKARTGRTPGAYRRSRVSPVKLL